MTSATTTTSLLLFTVCTALLLRCGFCQDDHSPLTRNVDEGDYNRYDFKWDKSELIYSISKYSEDMKRHQIRKVISRAFTVWSDVTPLTFTFDLNEASTNADINISFVTGEHGCWREFNTSEEKMVHSSVSEDTRQAFREEIHLNDAFNWSMDSPQDGEYMTMLLPVMIHEIGHVLGLGQSAEAQSIMAPDFDLNKTAPYLTEKDIQHIKAIYDVRTITVKHSRRRGGPSRLIVRDEVGFIDYGIEEVATDTMPSPDELGSTTTTTRRMPMVHGDAVGSGETSLSTAVTGSWMMVLFLVVLSMHQMQ